MSGGNQNISSAGISFISQDIRIRRVGQVRLQLILILKPLSQNENVILL